MRSKIIRNCRYVYSMLVEKVMEYLEYFKYKFKWWNEGKRNLVERYRIKTQYINEIFVQDFLKERKKRIENYGYRIEILIENTKGNEDSIGEVELMRKNKLIERAELITRNDVPVNERLVYWKLQQTTKEKQK